MRSLKIHVLALWCVIAVALSLNAATFQLNDGRTITGEILVSSANDVGAQVKVGDAQYEKISWGDLSQATLKELSQNEKLFQYVEPFLEVQQEEQIKKTEVELKEVPRLALPKKGSLLGALFTSSVGIVCLLIIYGANIYAGYEIAAVRARPTALVCGVSAVLPIIGPIIFLCMPTQMNQASQEPFVPASPVAVDEPAVNPMQGEPSAAPSGLHFAQAAQPAAAASSLPETQVFQRGQFTFNRRFIETKFTNFFGVVRREADKDMVLLFKTARGAFAVSRISRISASDLHVEVKEGPATQEVTIPFGEIQEIQLKHKDA